MTKRDPVIALLRAQERRIESFHRELRVIAEREGYSRQLATVIRTVLSYRLWFHGETIWDGEASNTVAELLTRRHRRSMTRDSKSWMVLRIWLAEHGYPNIDDSDGRPRCSACGALSRTGREHAPS